jgi:hypothetical protein
MDAGGVLHLFKKSMHDTVCPKNQDPRTWQHRRPPAFVKHFPTLVVVGENEPLVGPAAFAYIQRLIMAKQQNAMQQQHINNTTYQLKLMEMRQRQQGQSSVLGFTDGEMNSFSDPYAVLSDNGSLPQSYKDKEEGDSIVTPQVAAKMGKDEQEQRMRLLLQQRNEQNTFYGNQMQMAVGQELAKNLGNIAPVQEYMNKLKRVPLEEKAP